MLADLRQARRSLASSAGSTVIAFLTLAVGIGVSTAVFSLVESVLLRPLDYPDADRIVRVAEPSPGGGANGFDGSASGVSDVLVGQLLKRSETLDAITPLESSGQIVQTSGGTVHAQIGRVGATLFSLVGAQPIAGRFLSPLDEAPGSPPVAVIDERFWQDHLGRRTDLIGSGVLVDGVARTVVGIAPSITLPEPGIQLWIPRQDRWPEPGARRMFSVSVDVVARLRNGYTLERAQEEARLIALRVSRARGASVEASVPVVSVRRLKDDLVAPVQTALLTLLAGMALVLAAASTNLASLLLARSASRQREMSVRLALGASQWQIVRPLAIEQFLLVVSGGAAGAALATFILQTLPLLAPDLPRLSEVKFNGVALAGAACVSLATALLFGVLPARPLLRADGLHGRGRSETGRQLARRVRRALVAFQMAVASALLVGAVLFGRSLIKLSSINPGYQARGVLTFQVALPNDWYREPSRIQRLFTGLSDRLSRRPGVIAVGATSGLPLLPTGGTTTFLLDGEPTPASPAEFPTASYKAITPGLLHALGIRIADGRDVGAADSAKAERVVLVDEALVRRYFPRRNPIGTRIRWMGNETWTIAGIVESTHDRRLDESAHPTIYAPSAQLPALFAFNTISGGFAIRTSGDPIDLLPEVRSAVREFEPASPVFNAMRLEDRLDRTFAEPQLYALVLGLFASLVLATAVLGLYGILSFGVTQRRVEFGVRRALGGGTAHIVGLVLVDTAKLSLVGLGLGLTLAAFGGQLVRAFLFGIEPTDPSTFLMTSAVVMAMSAAATVEPIRRALEVDPNEVMKAG